jgi:DNA-binding XRE family transcriptional regulator
MIAERLVLVMAPPSAGMAIALKDDTKWIITYDPKRIKAFLMISVEQIRAARGLLGWSQTQLAKAAERSLPTIKRLERDDGEGPSVSEDVRDAVQRALEKAGIEFIAENGGGAGVRMKKRKR